jgi:ABC-type molybdenum transport system ATPase subunit/photorepair protein PhrA
MNVLETCGLGRRCRSTGALRDCSLSAPAGHVVALVGPCGAGKTTLLHLARKHPRLLILDEPLEHVADYLIVLNTGRLQVTGEVDGLLATHRVLTGRTDLAAAARP